MLKRFQTYFLYFTAKAIQTIPQGNYQYAETGLMANIESQFLDGNKYESRTAVPEAAENHSSVAPQVVTNTNHYSFNTTTSASLTDMSSCTTQLLAANSVNH